MNDEHRRVLKIMATYLLTWSPRAWSKWPNISKDAERVREGETITMRWSVGNRKSMEPASDVFLIRLGKDRPGLVSHGVIRKRVYADPHWDDERAEEGKTAYYVRFLPDYIVDVEREEPLDILALREPALSNLQLLIRRGLQASGYQLSESEANCLWQLWQEFIEAEAAYRSEAPPELVSDTYTEGALLRRTANRYERNAMARARCLKHYGYACTVCDRSFANVYGAEFSRIIEVHHLRMVSKIGEEYQVDPIKDLRPVCPNCHAALHAKTPPFTLEELRERLRENANGHRE